MKKSIFITALVALITLTSCKENAVDKISTEDLQVAIENAAADGKFPEMTFDKVEHDFGTIAQGTNVEHLFTFTNTGEAPLILSDAKGSCGCTVPEFTKDPVMPGEKGEMLVKFDGSGQNQRTISVNVTTNTQKGTERVTIKAFVDAPEGSNATGTGSISINPN